MENKENGFYLKEYTDLLRRSGLLIHKENTDNIFVRSFSYNSRNVGKDCLFICKGYNFKPEYLEDAIAKGAVCVLSEINYGFNGPYILVRDVRKALAIVSSLYYATKDAPIDLVGVTGTKGKSTTVYFLHNILAAAGIKNGYSTTVDMFDGQKSVEAILTTPESDICHRNIRTALDNGCGCFIMESSSQAFKLDRIFSMKFNYGIFVNISPDHISPHEHRDFDDYLSCKLNIVRMYENAVINYDDEHFEAVKAAAANAKRVLSYSTKSEEADIFASDIKKNGFETEFTLNLPEDIHASCSVRIPGVYNVSNALAAAGVAYMMGLDVKYIAEGIAKTKIPGRMEIFCRGAYTVIVDYAHNETSMKAALSAIKEYYPQKKLIALFGCPGGKALSRRYDMAYEASRLADYVYITSEDPGSEDPMTIAEEVKGYLDGFGLENEIITDRKTAVRTAVENLKPDCILLITGKGSEHYQLIGSQAVDYEGDTVLAEKYINELKEMEAL